MKKENKLIAEFMELPKVPCNIGTEDGHFNEGYKHPKVDVPIITSGMQYKYSWEWLMPVVEKIEEIPIENDNMIVKEHRYKIDMNNTECFIYDCIGDKVIAHGDYGTKLNSTYKAVVDFINEHNKKK
tara:strand:+ start:1346 stop:1726 length:381 start_codon:yes stop_codon:yes gene_type:complete